jgi:hypothetical protein
MTVQIDLPAEMERRLLRSAASAGVDVETYVKGLLIERLATNASTEGQGLSHEEFMARLRRIAETHPRSGGRMDDSRESIYDR